VAAGALSLLLRQGRRALLSALDAIKRLHAPAGRSLEQMTINLFNKVGPNR
jgi:hypothetical protein